MIEGSTGATGLSGERGRPGVIGSTGATGATGFVVHSARRRAVRAVGCPGSFIHNGNLKYSLSKVPYLEGCPSKLMHNLKYSF